MYRNPPCGRCGHSTTHHTTNHKEGHTYYICSNGACKAMTIECYNSAHPLQAKSPLWRQTN